MGIFLIAIFVLFAGIGSCYATSKFGLICLIPVQLIVAFVSFVYLGLLHIVGGTYEGIESIFGLILFAFLINLAILPFAYLFANSTKSSECKS